MSELESVSLGQLVLRALVLEAVIASEGDDAEGLAEPRRQLGLVTDEINRRCPEWKRPPAPQNQRTVLGGVQGEGIKIQLKTAEMEAKR